MPIFEFQCKKCGHVFEKIQSRSEGCPACAKCGEATEKKISMFGFTGGADGKSSARTGGHNCGSCHSHNCGSCH